MAYMKITSTDSLFFGGGKPFDSSHDSWTDSTFLPNPSVLWGALFSVLYREKRINIVNGKVSEEERKKLNIKNIYLYNEEQTTVLTPAPLDIFVDSDGKNYISKYRDLDFISNYPLEVISSIDTDREVKPLENHFIEINSLYQHYTKKYAKNLILYNFDDLFVADYKIGIEIDKESKIAKDKHLYRIDLTQFKKDWSFLVEYDCDIEFKESGLLKLGGEGKTAQYKKIEKPIGLESADKTKSKILEELEDAKYFKVLFKTPAYFKNGWKPNHSNLVCANVGKYISIGGFDMETNRPKKMNRYVPAGSVYVFKKDGKMVISNKDNESYKGFGSFEYLTI